MNTTTTPTPDDLRARLRILANDYPVGSIHHNTVEQAIAALSAPAAGKGVDVEAMLKDCVPGGSVCDPQVVADNIRGWYSAPTRQPVAGMDTPKEGVKLYHWRLIERGSKMPLTGWNEVTKERFDEMRRLYFFGEGINGDFEGRVVEITSIETF